MLLKCHFDLRILRFPQIYTIFVAEITLETWFPWQQVKVYPQTFDFETLSVNIGEKSQIFEKMTFVAPKLLRKNMGGR